MKKNLMLLKWFLKFNFVKTKDEYNTHDYIKDAFCPEFMSAEDFDEKEQILRDTPGPVGIKYAYYVGMAVNGILGAIFAITAALIPAVLGAVIIYFVYNYLYSGSQMTAMAASYVFNGMCATALGLVAAHVYKMIYFNRTNRKSVTTVVLSALLFFLIPMLMTNHDLEIGTYTYDLIPFYLIIVVVAGVVMGFLHNVFVKKRIAKENDPNRVIDPYSKKAIRERDRKLREEEYEMLKDRNLLAELKKELKERKKRK